MSRDEAPVSYLLVRPGTIGTGVRRGDMPGKHLSMALLMAVIAQTDRDTNRTMQTGTAPFASLVRTFTDAGGASALR